MSADRQGSFVRDLTTGGLAPNEVRLWYDWAQSWSLPQAHVELNTMVHGAARAYLDAY